MLTGIVDYPFEIEVKTKGRGYLVPLSQFVLIEYRSLRKLTMVERCRPRSWGCALCVCVCVCMCLDAKPAARDAMRSAYCLVEEKGWTILQAVFFPPYKRNFLSNSTHRSKTLTTNQLSSWKDPSHPDHPWGNRLSLRLAALYSRMK